MLTSLGIRNYRCFESLDVERLGRINLVAGKNNSGKTSLLEAIVLLSSGGQAELASNPVILRTNSPAENNSRTIILNRWNLMFFDLNVETRIQISGSHENFGAMKLEISRKRQDTIRLTPNEADIFSVHDRADFNDCLFSFSSAATKEKIEGTAQIYENGIQITNSKDAKRVFSFGFTDGKNTDPTLAALRLGNLRRQGRDAPVLKALQAVEPDIQRVEANPGSGVPTILVDIGLGELVPLSVMGEGMTRLAQMMIYLCGLPNGIVLIDEVENGLHHSVLATVWKTLEKAAVDLDVQIVATTHSYECFEAAHKALDPDNFLYHRLEAGSRGHRCVTYDADRIAGAIHYNMEAR